MGTRSSSFSREILRILWKHKIHYRVRNRPPGFPIQTHIIAVHILAACSFKNQFSDFLELRGESFVCFRFVFQNSDAFMFCSIHNMYTTRLILHDLLIW